MLKKICKWFNQDALWDIYLKSMHTKSKCLDDSGSSAGDKIKYIYESRNVSFEIYHELFDPYALSEVNDYELRYNISIPIYVKCYMVEITKFVGWNMICLGIAPILRPDGMIKIKLGEEKVPFIKTELVIDKEEAFIGTERYTGSFTPVIKLKKFFEYVFTQNDLFY